MGEETQCEEQNEKKNEVNKSIKMLKAQPLIVLLETLGTTQCILRAKRSGSLIWHNCILNVTQRTGIMCSCIFSLLVVLLLHCEPV